MAEDTFTFYLMVYEKGLEPNEAQAPLLIAKSSVSAPELILDNPHREDALRRELTFRETLNTMGQRISSKLADYEGHYGKQQQRQAIKEIGRARPSSRRVDAPPEKGTG